MNLNERKNKIISEMKKENNFLLDICNKIERNLNFLNDYEYINEYFSKFNNKYNSVFMNDIHLLNENSFKFHLKLNGNFKNDYKILNSEKEYLENIIKFYGKFIKKDILLIVLINNLCLNTEITNINLFYNRI